MLYFDNEHGRLLAVIDASSVTAIRTAAVSGLATRLLSNPGASRLAILGAGVQAMTHLEAMLAVRPITDVRIWSRTQAKCEAFARWAKQTFNIAVQTCATAEAAVHGAEIVCTVTASREPVLRGAWLAPGVHINAVGAAQASARELDTDAVQHSRFYVDRRESALNEAGDFLLPRAEGQLMTRISSPSWARWWWMLRVGGGTRRSARCLSRWGWPWKMWRRPRAFSNVR